MTTLSIPCQLKPSTAGASEAADRVDTLRIRCATAIEALTLIIIRAHPNLVKPEPAEALTLVSARCVHTSLLTNVSSLALVYILTSRRIVFADGISSLARAHRLAKDVVAEMLAAAIVIQTRICVLTRSIVVSHLMALMALAVVAAVSINAVMAATTIGYLAFIAINTMAIVLSQLVAGIALTAVTAVKVLADVFTATVETVLAAFVTVNAGEPVIGEHQSGGAGASVVAGQVDTIV